MVILNNVSFKLAFGRIGRKFLVLIVVLSTHNSAVYAHQGEPPKMLKISFAKTAIRDELVLSPIDANKLRVESERKRSTKSIQTKTIDYAVPEKVVATPATHGSWVSVSGGDVWRLSVKAPGATDLNFGFTKYMMPMGATLHVYDAEKRHFQGPYTAKHNYQHGQLWTPLTPGSEALIEVFVPSGSKDKLKLELGTVGKGYRNIFQVGLSSIIKQGSCNIDVICTEGDPWRDEIRSVSVYGLDGSKFCTGTLINNVEQDFKPFFLTANHCTLTSSNAASVVAYWNYESPSCGALTGGALSDNTSGATFRASNVGNDMSLIELSSTPLSSYNVHYAGWDATSSLSPTGSVAIHHPNVDEKAISFNDDALATSSSCIGPSDSNTHWIVDNWEQGTTEPGSSGSALFDPATKRLIGYLSGGAASCSNTAGLDCYGKFSVGWSLGLSDWLDPNTTGTMFIDGVDPGTGPLDPDAQLTRRGETLLYFLPAIISAASKRN